ncbi:MAG TPA: hypothetical protein VJW76_13180 [Verrucomicrobiae bacterium]|nr:hypothetical protein [Verrucomicrobiae bacterium]
MKLVGDTNRRGDARPSPPARRQAGIMLGECLIYISVWSVLLGLSFAAYYRVLDNTTRLRRSAADITRVLQAGERWREDVRQATGPLKPVGIEGTVEHALHVPQAAGEVVYYFTGTNLLRRAAADAPWIEFLARVNASRMNKDTRERVVAWRWEVELNAGKKKPAVRPLFSFQAVAPVQEQP